LPIIGRDSSYLFFKISLGVSDISKFLTGQSYFFGTQNPF
jgi:hypothetical protein